MENSMAERKEKNGAHTVGDAHSHHIELSTRALREELKSLKQATKMFEAAMMIFEAAISDENHQDDSYSAETTVGSLLKPMVDSCPKETNSKESPHALAAPSLITESEQDIICTDSLPRFESLSISASPYSILETADTIPSMTVSDEKAVLVGATSESMLASKLATISTPTIQMDTKDMISDRIIRLLYTYSPNQFLEQATGRVNFTSAVRDTVRENQPIHMVLPAFPFKSPNRKDKVLGSLPDLGEELALARLEGLCAALDDIYPGTTVSIISDGLMYSDILGVSEVDVWEYGTALRRIAKDTFPHISFARLSRLISKDLPESTTPEVYAAKASWYREQILSKYLPVDFDVSRELKENVNSLMTYRGYIKFLETDLRHEHSRQGLSSSQIKKLNKAVAKHMIRRGTAFSRAINEAFPQAIRLSIHASEINFKFPISLFPGKEGYTTPWHCACALELDGSYRFVHAEMLSNDPDYELVFRGKQPLYYRRKSELYVWGDVEIDVEPLYPCGLRITPRNTGEGISIREIDMEKIRGLAEFNSPILLRGFRETKNLALFTQKAREMGSVMPWKFGDVLVVKDAGFENGGLNNVLSPESMPMHFDGLFKTAKHVGEDGLERLIPQAPRFQFFSAVTPSPKNSGLTLMAASRILFDLLPKPFTVEQLRLLTWSVETTAFNNAKLTGLKLVESHPILGTPCLRYHEPWLEHQTKFDPSYVHIENGPDVLLDVLNELLYDRKVCYYHAWEDGDLIVSDNINMMHTRSSFTAGTPRELWRVHIN